MPKNCPEKKKTFFFKNRPSNPLVWLKIHKLRQKFSNLETDEFSTFVKFRTSNWKNGNIKENLQGWFSNKQFSANHSKWLLRFVVVYLTVLATNFVTSSLIHYFKWLYKSSPDHFLRLVSEEKSSQVNKNFVHAVILLTSKMQTTSMTVSNKIGQLWIFAPKYQTLFRLLFLYSKGFFL